MSDTFEPLKPRLLVVMGVSGSGKTTIAQALCQRYGWPFQEGDELHPAANVEKMRSGIPLTDEDRAPWLLKCHDWLESHIDTGGVLTCSALKRSYRDLLRKGLNVTFVYLHAPEKLISDRMAHRVGHYMPPSLLPSQIATLEIPGPDEPVIRVDSEDAPDVVLAHIIQALHAEEK
ncbi:gluconokinase [Kozakia baliensis]|uniref:gluconokinase n=1 Tax=Kozakia baliensis TaxID=153496 RepID=UPI00345B9624